MNKPRPTSTPRASGDFERIRELLRESDEEVAELFEECTKDAHPSTLEPSAAQRRRRIA